MSRVIYKNSFRRETRDVLVGGVPTPRVHFVADCRKCDNETALPLDSHNTEYPIEVAERKFADLGWKMGKTRRKDVCPSCVARGRVLSAPEAERGAVQAVETRIMEARAREHPELTDLREFHIERQGDVAPLHADTALGTIATLSGEIAAPMENSPMTRTPKPAPPDPPKTLMRERMTKAMAEKRLLDPDVSRAERAELLDLIEAQTKDQRIDAARTRRTDAGRPAPLPSKTPVTTSAAPAAVDKLAPLKAGLAAYRADPERQKEHGRKISEGKARAKIERAKSEQKVWTGLARAAGGMRSKAIKDNTLTDEWDKALNRRDDDTPASYRARLDAIKTALRHARHGPSLFDLNTSMPETERASARTIYARLVRWANGVDYTMSEDDKFDLLVAEGESVAAYRERVWRKRAQIADQIGVSAETNDEPDSIPEPQVAAPASAPTPSQEQPTMATDSPRVCPPATAGRIIRALLDDHYDVEQERYNGDMSDAKLAEQMDIPRAWVTQEREKFGPDVNEIDAQGEEKARAYAALKEEVSRRDDEFERKISEIDQRWNADQAKVTERSLAELDRVTQERKAFMQTVAERMAAIEQGKKVKA